MAGRRSLDLLESYGEKSSRRGWVWPLVVFVVVFALLALATQLKKGSHAKTSVKGAPTSVVR